MNEMRAAGEYQYSQVQVSPGLRLQFAGQLSAHTSIDQQSKPQQNNDSLASSDKGVLDTNTMAYICILHGQLQQHTRRAALKQSNLEYVEKNGGASRNDLHDSVQRQMRPAIRVVCFLPR